MKSVILLLLISYSPFAAAMSWMDLWLRPDQQGIQLLKQGKAEQAAKKFDDLQWQGVANYRAGDYQQAGQKFNRLNTADAHYNRGNALALQGNYQAAIAAYEQALTLNPNHADAKYNLEIVKQQLRQQKQAQTAAQNSAASNNQSQQKSSRTDNKGAARQDNSPQNSASPQVQNKQPAQAATKQYSQANQPPSNSTPDDKQETQSNQATRKQQAAEREQASAGERLPATAQTANQKAAQEASEQWLRQIPDDPGGLLRQKFLRDYERMQASE